MQDIRNEETTEPSISVRRNVKLAATLRSAKKIESQFIYHSCIIMLRMIYV